MNCPRPEILSGWVDGTLDGIEAHGVLLHVETCAACRAKADDLRAAGEWLKTASEPGPRCLTPDRMAAILEGAPAPEHVETCPRCAAEFEALRAAVTKPATARLYRVQRPAAAWAAAAILFVAVGALLIMTPKRDEGTGPVVYTPSPRPRLAPPPAFTPAPAPKPAEPPRPQPAETRTAEAPKPAERPTEPVAKPPTDSPVTPAPTTPDKPAAPTVAAPAPRPEVALALKSGMLTTLAEGKWVKPPRVEEGMTLRAEGKTTVEFARARVTLEPLSRFSLEKSDLSLSQGGLSAEVPKGSNLSIVVANCRIVPQAAAGRVLLSARADRVRVDEGAAKSDGLVLPEGVEHRVVNGRPIAQRVRTLPAALRPRETVAWRLDLAKSETRSRITSGWITNALGRRVIESGPSADPSLWAGQTGYLHQEPAGFYTVKPGTALRFRYYLKDAAPLQLVVKNVTKDENFNLDIDAVAGQWTTLTIPVHEIPVNRGGKKVVFETGDALRSLGWFVGKPGTEPQLLIDQLEIVEVQE